MVAVAEKDKKQSLLYEEKIDPLSIDERLGALSPRLPLPIEAMMDEMEFRNLLKVIELDLDTFSDHQIKILQTSGKRVIVITGGNRSGKTFVTALKLLTNLWFDITRHRVEPGDEYWLVGYEYVNTKAEYNLLRKWLSKLGWLEHAPETYVDATMKIKRCPVKTCDPRKKCDHPPVVILTKSTLRSLDKIASTAPAFIAVCEAAQLQEEAFHRLIIRTADKRSQMIVSGTMDRVTGWFLGLLRDLQSKSQQDRKQAIAYFLPTMSNKFLFKDGENDPEIQFQKEWLSPEAFENRIQGLLTVPTHYVFGREFNRTLHVAPLEFDPTRDVWLGIDPGYASAYSVVCCQFVRTGDIEQVRVFDEIFVRNVGVEGVIRMLKARPWFPQANITAICDPAGKAHPSDRSQKNVWEEKAGIDLLFPKITGPREQIPFLRSFFVEDPVTHLSKIKIAPKCRGLLSELGDCDNPITERSAAYCYKLGEDQHIIGDEPIDQNNHAVKALTYMLLKARGPLEGKRTYKPKKTLNRVRTGYQW